MSFTRDALQAAWDSHAATSGHTDGDMDVRRGIVVCNECAWCHGVAPSRRRSRDEDGEVLPRAYSAGFDAVRAFLAPSVTRWQEDNDASLSGVPE